MDFILAGQINQKTSMILALLLKSLKSSIGLVFMKWIMSPQLFSSQIIHAYHNPTESQNIQFFYPNPDMSFGRPGLWGVRIKKIVPFARIRAVRTYFYCRGLEST